MIGSWSFPRVWRRLFHDDDRDYWLPPDELKSGVEYWYDDDDDRGILTADRIEYYAKTLNMIGSFCEKNLKPASYSLTLGPDYQLNGKMYCLTNQDPILVIPRNSIVFVRMREYLALPHYIVGRFNLSIDLVYKGLLLGTGPQVDPGFQGFLSCPLHNLSNSDIHIKLGEHFATIDFAKTTKLPRNSTLRSIHSEEELYRRASNLRRDMKYPLRLFRVDKRWKRPILDYPPGTMTVSSSVAPLGDTVEGLRKEFEGWRRLGIVGALIGLASLLGLVYASWSFVSDQHTYMVSQVQDSRNDARDFEKELTALRLEHAALRIQLTDVERRLQAAEGRLGASPTVEGIQGVR